MEKLFTVFLFFQLLITSHLTVANKRRPIRSVLAPAEMISNYEIVAPVIINQSEEITQSNPHELWIKLDLPSKTFELHLTMNKNLLSPRYTEISFEDGKNVVNKGHKNCFYHGTVLGFPNWTVAMSTCEGLRGTFGNHEDVDTLYHIEPLGEMASSEITQIHVVFNSSELSVQRRNGTCGYNDSHSHGLLHYNFTMSSSRVQRQSATRIVEWFIYNDRRQFLAQQGNLTQTALHSIEIANVVDLLFARIDIRVSLVGVQTWNQQDLITVVSDPNTLLDNFHSFLELPSENFDSAMLIAGIDLDGSTIGLAPVGVMCRGSISAALTQDTGSSVASVASTAAHELGHIFNMRHDDGRGCSCAGANNRCIMGATLSQPPPVEWSSCSIDDLNDGYAEGLDRCLFNEPSDIFGDPVCGNGVREGDEVCDCGTPQLCDDICCDPNTCQLVDGAKCSNREPCCSSCQFRSSGMVCRSATGECDITEYCTGTSGECPADRSRQDGVDCASGQFYCFSGACQDLNSFCNATFAPNEGITPSVGPQECFDFNTDGTVFGNCGHDSTDYLPCAVDDVRCGQLHCRDGSDFILPVDVSVSILGRTTSTDGGFVRCRSFSSQPGADTMPGLVPEGARCGTNMLCRNRQCVARQLVACPSANSQECSGNGVCNDLNQCSCDPGFTGDSCNSTVTGDRVDGGFTQWSSWSSCSATCGAGTRTRTRNCTNPTPQGGGADCVGASSNTESCNILPCSDNDTRVVGDPHFTVPLLSGNTLCYSIQGYPGLAFNLIHTKGYIINALFIDSIGDVNEATWIGKLAVIPRHANTSEIVIFDSVKQEVVLVDQGQFKASIVDQISYDENGKMSVKFTRGIAKQVGNPTVHVKYGRPVAHFDVTFYHNHVDVNWDVVYEGATKIHGLMGQFMKKGMSIDPIKKILTYPDGHDPVAVEMDDVMTGKMCWKAMNPGHQGEGLIEGSILDYMVSSLLQDDFKLKKF